MSANETRKELVDIRPPGIDDGFLIEPAYAESRNWGLYYVDDRPSYEQLESVVPVASLHSGIYMRYTLVNTRETKRITGDFKYFWEIFVTINSDRCCVFDQANNFLVTVIEADASIIATDRGTMQAIFGAAETSRAEWIEEAERLRPDLRAEILAKYVRDL